MSNRVLRPSRLIRAIARWAITFGAAGTIVGGVAAYGVFLDEELARNSQDLLKLAAILLSLAFVLAPFVRNTFAPAALADEPKSRGTLLDEMRSAPHSEGAALSDAPAEGVAASNDAAVVTESPLTARLIIVVYVIFAATLLTILWALQTQ
jgi:hypothetical protein